MSISAMVSEGVVCVYLDDILIFTETRKSMTGDPLGTGTTPTVQTLSPPMTSASFAQTKIEYLGSSSPMDRRRWTQ